MVPNIKKTSVVVLKTIIKILVCLLRVSTRRRQKVFIIFGTIITLGLLPHWIAWIFRKPLGLEETRSIVENRSMEYCLQEKGKGCERPKLDPFSAEVMALTRDMPKVTCDGFDWIVCKKSECYVTQEILNNVTDISCDYRDIMYVNDQEYYLSDSTIIKGGDNLFTPRWEGVKTGLRPVKTYPNPQNHGNSYNVMILAFDSSSHNGFMRKMPKSYKYLSKNAIIMNGYNIVGDGTPAALLPILTGKSEEEHPDARKKITKKVYVDHRSFIFHKLKSFGYQTAYWEDSPHIGTFQYRFNGFQHQPADHYFRAFFLEHNSLSFFTPKYCTGSTPTYELMMNISDELDGKKFCFTIIGDICHDDFEQISTADDFLLSFMESWSSRKVLEDTLLVVMGDHGSRFSKLRETYHGKLEERLPLLSIFLPEKLKRLRPDAVAALNENIERLTTPFDLHTTVLDVLDLKDLSNMYTIPGCNLLRALSLLTPIPASRSCADAGIAQHWCTCTKWQSVDASSPMYNRVANALAEYINSLTSELRSKCEIRQMTFVKSVLRQKVDDQVLKYVNYKEEDAFFGNPQISAPKAPSEYYMATIIMNPGRAVFEGSVVYNTQTYSFTITKSKISRLSPYKNEPHCISATHPHLNPFCYCKDLPRSKTNVEFLKTIKKMLVCLLRVSTRRRQKVFIVFGTIITLGLLPHWITRDIRKPLGLEETRSIVENRSMEYCLQEKGKGCERPKLDPFSAEVMALTRDMPKITCDGFDWIVCKKSECYVTQEILNNVTDISCDYRDIMYVNDQEYYLSNSTIIKGGDNLFTPGWEGVKTGLRPVKTYPNPQNHGNSYNVMILAFDSSSHNGFMRKMPKSYKYLSKNAIIMNGFNIVGDGTPAALFPIFTGKPEEEHPDARKKITKNVYVDHRSFIFYKLKSFGYQTAYWEDSPDIGTFQYRFNGFQHQPADHYFRPFFLEHSSLPFNTPQYCTGSTPTYELMMNISDELFQLDGKKFCFTIIGDICHNDFNQMSTADDFLLSFMESWSSRKVLEDTLLVVMGDHGSRFSKLRETYHGKLEERLPLLSIFLPEKLKRLRPDAVAALNENIERLTTPFDLHTTVLDVLDLKDLSNMYTIPGCNLQRALSLLTPIPASRSCADAGIAQHWCTCTKWQSVDASSPMYNRVANALAEYINSLTSELRSKCENRQMTFVKSVLRQKVDDQVLKYVNYKEEDAFFGNPQMSAPKAPSEYYTATIIMNPGRAIFEGTVVYNTQTYSFTITKSEISRLSPYKNEPHCISATHPHLNPFCYCKDLPRII
ncbi:hypothetical protein HW555_008632 [Spodoptera exigua]|uniref:Uncharacterized protein n=1 Tax=Spodoptera exigua TaxID=7107 RepID=A0A835GEP6_SPOEX|nr:hypothetical protein HW555_008632 [Spodoptera exigua]